MTVTAESAASALAASPPPLRIGPEFTFTNGTLFDLRERYLEQESVKKQYIERLLKHYATSVCAQRRCVVNETTRTITYPDGWWFKISSDPRVLEVQAKPMTGDEIRRLEGRIQRDLFDVMAEIVDLRPHPVDGGGHLNLSADFFLGRDTLYRNFTVDWANHWELATGVFLDDLKNARPVSRMTEKEREAFRRIMLAFDENRLPILEFGRTRNNLTDIILQLNQQISYEPGHDKFIDLFHGHLLRELNRGRPELARLEIRSFRAQRSARDFRLQAELLEARLNRLAALGEKRIPVVFDPVNRSIGDRLARYFTYVDEAGLGHRWAEFAELLPPEFARSARDPDYCLAIALETLLGDGTRAARRARNR